VETMNSVTFKKLLFMSTKINGENDYMESNGIGSWLKWNLRARPLPENFIPCCL